MRTALLIAALALAGCTTISEHKAPPADWPRLRVIENVVPATEMLGRCYKYLTFAMKLMGGFPLACAEVDFNAKTCTIWRVSWTPKSVTVHEYDHCDGRDHEDDSALADALAAWRAGGGR